jgi:hypothetical protein
VDAVYKITVHAQTVCRKTKYEETSGHNNDKEQIWIAQQKCRTGPLGKHHMLSNISHARGWENIKF